VDLQVPGPGRIEARAEWTGTATKLALILNGPGKTQYYARKDGPSPLTLSFDITADLLAKGTAWKISVADFQANSSAQGTVRITLPKAPSAGAQTRAQTQAKEKPAAGTGQAQRTKPSRQNDRTQAATATEIATTTQAEENWTSAEVNEIAALTAKIRSTIPRLVQQSPLAGILVPLFYQSLEDMAGRPELLREYFNSSQHKNARTESEFARMFKKAVRAYKNVPLDFKKAHFNPDYAALTNAQSVDYRLMADNIIKVAKPLLVANLQAIIKTSLDPRRIAFMTPQAGAPQPASQKTVRATRTSTRAATARPVSQTDIRRVGTIAKAGQAGLSGVQKSELKSVLETQGFPVSERATPNLFYQALGQKYSLAGSLPALNAEAKIVDYYRYKITLDSFICTNKNETTDDEPYFSILTAVPQFDPSDPGFFDKLADGCLNRSAGFTTRTYEDVTKNSERGLKGNDRIIFDELTYNSAASVTVDLWEEDFSKGSVADGIRRAAEDLARNMMSKIHDAVQQRLIEIFAETIFSTVSSVGGMGSKDQLYLIEQLVGGDLSLADFETLLHNLLSGKAIDPTWYVLYFLFSGCDWMETIAMIGGGSTVIGWFLLALAVVGPTLSSFYSNIFRGDFKGAMIDFFKIITILPLIWDFFKTIALQIWHLIEWFLAIVDPDDHIGTESIILGEPSADWHNDARNSAGELIWTQPRLMGGVQVGQAASSFRQKGYGPTSDNSSLISNGIFWVPGFTFQTESMQLGTDGRWHPGVGTAYDVYYQAKRDVAAGRATYGYYLPDPAFSSRTIGYTAKPAGRGNVIRVSLMSMNTTELPFAYLWENSTGKGMGNFSGEPSFELKATPGSDYTLYITKICAGEIGGYVTLAEGPVIKKDRDVTCPPPLQVPGGGLGSGHWPPKKLK
jgi:hypothetical protein